MSRKNPTILCDNPEGSWKTWGRLLKMIVPFWPIFILALLANVAYSSIDAWFVHFLKPLINDGFIEKDSVFIKGLPWLIISVFVGRAVANIVGTYCMGVVARNLVMQLRQRIFRHYLQLPAAFYDKCSAGHMLSLINYNVSQVANAGAEAITTFLQALVLTVGLLIVMFSLSWKLSLIYFTAIPFIILIVVLASKRTRILSHAVQASMGDVTAIAEEGIGAYKVVRTFGGHDYETNRFDKATIKNRRRELKIILTKALSISGVQLCAAIVLAIIVSIAAGGGVDSLTAGAFASFMAAMLAILKPMKDLANVNSKIQRGLAAAQSVFGVLQEPLEPNAIAKPLSEVRGDIDFSIPHFSYGRGAKPALYDIKLSVPAKKITALVGRSGSGKSTLISLLLRFYEVDDRQIHIDQADINQYDLQQYRRHFSYVSQQIVLFNDTVAHNIAYGLKKKNVSFDAIKQAAKSAHALEFIEQLPNGFDTIVGDGGLLLSGGQRQRIAIARAILKDAPILLLDEATSALDTESERYIQHALLSLMRGRTTIVIAHRLSTIQQADNIVVMDGGKIVEQGSHHALLEQNGYYTRLHQLQFGSD